MASNTHQLIQAFSKYFSLVTVHFQLDGQTDLMLYLIYTSVEVSDHAVEAQFVGLHDCVHCLLRNE